MKIEVSDVLAILGALALVVGVGMFRIAAGVITLGLVLILGAVMTMQTKATAKKAVK